MNVGSHRPGANIKKIKARHFVQKGQCRPYERRSSSGPYFDLTLASILMSVRNQGLGTYALVF